MCASFLLIASSRAMAGPVSFVDTFDPPDVFFSQNGSVACHGNNGVNDTVTATIGCHSLDWTHSLIPLGFNPATDTLTSGTLSLTFYDDDDSPAETFDVVFDSLTASDQLITSGTTAGAPFQISYDALSQLSDGILSVTVTNPNNGNHDFYFAKAVLTASGTRISGEPEVPASVPVPEPGTMTLLGVSLIAFGYRRMRKG
jgi:hypothetical protein